MKLQRDAAPFLLLNGEKALRQPLGLAFYPLAGRGVGNDADEPGRSLVRGFLVLGVNLDPALVSTAALDAARHMEAAASSDCFLYGSIEFRPVVWM